MLTRQPTRHEVVREHMHDTVGFLAADSEPCLGVRDREIAAVLPRVKPQKTGRVLKPLRFADLSDLEPGRSWALAVLLCKGDTTENVCAFVRRHGPAWRDRVQFYHHPDADLSTCLEAWVAAGLPPPLVETVSGQVELHAHFGRFLNERIYEDHRAKSS